MPFPLPPLGVNASLVPFAVVALAMIAITIFVLGQVLPRDGRSPLVTQMLLALAVLGGGSVLLLALVFVFLNPDGTSAWTWVLLAFNFMMMAPAGIWFIGLVIFRDRRVTVDDWAWPVSLGLVTTGSEVLMGLLFVVGDANGASALAPTFALGLSSIWFFWSMAAIMVALLLWAPLDPIERGALVTLTLAAVIGPWVTAFPIVGGIAMTVLMAGAFAVIVRAITQRRDVRAEEAGLLLGLAAAFLATALTGLALVATGGTVAAVLAFGSVMAVVMGVEIAYLVRRFYLGPPSPAWVRRAISPEEGARPDLRRAVTRADGPASEAPTGLSGAAGR